MKGRESMASWILVKSPAARFLATVNVYAGKSLFFADLKTECFNLPTKLTHFMNCCSENWVLVIFLVCCFPTEFLGLSPLVWHNVWLEQRIIVTRTKKRACSSLAIEKWKENERKEYVERINNYCESWTFEVVLKEN